MSVEYMVARSSPFTRTFTYEPDEHRCVASFACELCSFSTLRPSLDVRLPNPTARAAAIAFEATVPHYTPGEQFTVSAVFAAPSQRTFQCAATQTSLSVTTSVLVGVDGSTKDPRNPTGLIAELAATTIGDSVTAVASEQCGPGTTPGVGLAVLLQQNQVTARLCEAFDLTRVPSRPRR